MKTIIDKLPDSKKIHNKLRDVFDNLLSVYGANYDEHRIHYVYDDLNDAMLNAIKALEFHYRDDVSPMQKAYGFTNHPEHTKAINILKKYSEPITQSDRYSLLQMKQEHRLMKRY